MALVAATDRSGLSNFLWMKYGNLESDGAAAFVGVPILRAGETLSEIKVYEIARDIGMSRERTGELIKELTTTGAIRRLDWPLIRMIPVAMVEIVAPRRSHRLSGRCGLVS